MRPLSLLIKPASGLCNMRCRYCFYADVAEHRETASYGHFGRKEFPWEKTDKVPALKASL